MTSHVLPSHPSSLSPSEKTEFDRSHMLVGGKASPGAKFATSLVLVWTVWGFTWSWRAQATGESRF